MTKPTYLKSLLLLMLCSTVTMAQKPFSSPYSRYGIGELFKSTNCQTMAMGGAGIGIRDASFINFQNPASYSAFDSLTFLFDGAVTSNFQTLKSENNSQKANYTTLKHLLFGFPVTHRWKTSVGLLPYSQVGYKVGDEEYPDSIGYLKKYYEGSGGFNQVYLGNAWMIGKHLSLGLNVSYLFGGIDRTRSVTFPDSLYIRNFRVQDNIHINDFSFQYGLQYHTKLNKSLLFTAGATFSNTTHAKAGKSTLSESFTQTSLGSVTVMDTIDLIPEQEGIIVLPGSYGAGFSVEKPQHWLFTGEFQFQDWSQFKVFGEEDSLKNCMQAALGFQIIPNINSITSYAQRISYRFGISYARSYLEMKGHQLDDLSGTFGLGFPLAKTRSRVNLGMKFGRLGTTQDHLIQENYFMITLGVSVLENWFYKRKFE